MRSVKRIGSSMRRVRHTRKMAPTAPRHDDRTELESLSRRAGESLSQALRATRSVGMHSASGLAWVSGNQRISVVPAPARGCTLQIRP
jgi:hypothetical protein